MTWLVDVSTDRLDGPDIEPESIWAPSRQVEANDVRVAASKENERFIFYRGLGNFDLPFHVTNPKHQGENIDRDELKLNNSGEEDIPNAFLLHTDGKQGYIGALQGIDAHSGLTIPTPYFNKVKTFPMDMYVAEISRLLAHALEKTGLNHDESLAMVNTWSKSYFRTPGMRVLYVLPRSQTDKLLPMHIAPEPKSLVRTLVGRIEIMTRAEEVDLLKSLAGDLHRKAPPNLESLGRFAEPKLRRVRELATDEALRVYIDETLALLPEYPLSPEQVSLAAVTFESDGRRFFLKVFFALAAGQDAEHVAVFCNRSAGDIDARVFTQKFDDFLI
jgi:hypothetical protein